MLLFKKFVCLLCFLLPFACGICRKLIDLSSTDTSFHHAAMNWSNIEDYTITELVGTGSFGEAYLGHHVTSHEKYLFKIYKFGKQSMKKMRREIAVAQHLCGHPNIVELHHIVKQGLTGNPILLFDYVNNTNHHELYPTLQPEDEVYYMHELLKGLAFAHRQNVVHKDLKPANVVFDRETRELKIIDWGLSEFYHSGGMQGVSGTTQYMAPELLLGYRYSSFPVDMWAYGCMLGALMFRDTILFPGHGKISQLHTIARMLGTEELIQYIEKYDLNFNTSVITSRLPKVPWEEYVDLNNTDRRNYASPEAIDLLQHLLVYDHNERLTAQEALMHPYFKGQDRVDKNTIYKIYYQESEPEPFTGTASV